MPADNSAHLVTAARRRHELTRSKAIQALRELERTGAAITFEAVARAAAVSRSWLYTQADLRSEIQRLRPETRPTSRPTVPAGERATDASLRQRLEEANARIRQLTEDNQRLRRQLAHALGDQRAHRQPAAERRGSATMGPC
ncbi:DUF6262 family protein [Kitasatospora sp. NPDC096128]|uniref:DUF6262 family protein n=1 Tax=Kitasatospora sp. NPDC096128 TaxID=3155547 RepID=UPI003320E17F